MTPSESTQPTPTSQLNPEDTSCGIDYPTAIVCEELHRRRVRRFEDMLVDYRDNPEFADGVRVVQSYMSSRNFTREELDRGLALYETGALQIHGVNLGEKVFETTGWMVTHESAETLLPKQYRNLLEDVAHVRSFFYINEANLRVIEETPGRWIYLHQSWDNGLDYHCIYGLSKSNLRLKPTHYDDDSAITVFESVDELVESLAKTWFLAIFNEPKVRNIVTLHRAARDGTLANVPPELFEPVADGKSPWDMGDLGDTPLHCAAREGRLHLVPRQYLTAQRLLAGGYFNVDRCPAAITPLTAAVITGEREFVVRTILEFPAADWVNANAEEWFSLAEQAEQVGITKDIAPLLREIKALTPARPPEPEKEMVEVDVPCIGIRLMPKPEALLAGFIESSDSPV